MTMTVQSDPAFLVPAFRERVLLVLDDMRALGWQPVLFETRRSRERAEMLHKRGTGSRDSMHIYDVAADIVDGDRHNVPRRTKEGLWDAPDKFWADLEDCAHARGLHRLYKRGVVRNAIDDKAQSWDKPHIQACPQNPVIQDRLRAMTRDQRDEWCRQQFADFDARQALANS